MSNLQGHVGELTFTVQVKRKETGKVEEYQLVSGITQEQAEKLGLESKVTENDNVCNP